ncbi:TonB C terminal [Variovorax sp. OK605]|uniref:TonB family protein n=1 Tax=Variovorax sp. OK605 TaxID=1855317 RepID=UPI0008EEFE22|nr:TonB family protein [Variovorax sp. OK605]SFQ33675.1 TonB C terminal [Variovorax sp. OK605]
MTEVPGFLLELGLRPDADERAVRRAYAVELKKIDQETQAQQFQRLREAYEAALYWARHARETETAQEVQTAPAAASAQPSGDVAQPEPEPEPVPAPAPVAIPSPAPAAHGEHAPSPPLAAVDDRTVARHDNVRDLMVALDTRLREDPLQTVREATALLEATLEDPRLLDMDTRVLFEANIAHLLACGWRPGHEYLFEAALGVFDWRTDSARLLRLGQAGQVVDRAIVEQDAQAQQPPADRDTQRQYLELLRRTADPGLQALALGLGRVMHAAHTYPTWLRLTMDTANIEHWRERNADLARSTAQNQPSMASAHSGSITPSQMKAWFVAFCGAVVLIFLLKTVVTGEANQGATTASTAAGRAGAAAMAQAIRKLPTSQSSPASRSELPDTGANDATGRLPALQAPLNGKTGAAAPSAQRPAIEPDPPVAQYTRQPHVAYPAMSRRLGEQGLVVLRIMVQPTGSVSDATVLQSSGFERLDAAAIDAVRGAQVAPMKSMNGRAVAAWYKASINFLLSDVASGPATSTKPGSKPSYGDTVTAAVRPNILFSKDVPGNPLVEYTLDLAADGKIVAAKLSRASGVPEWDAAALRAIQKTGHMPLTEQGTVPPKMVLALRPKVQ